MTALDYREARRLLIKAGFVELRHARHVMMVRGDQRITLPSSGKVVGWMASLVLKATKDAK